MVVNGAVLLKKLDLTKHLPQHAIQPGDQVGVYNNISDCFVPYQEMLSDQESFPALLTRAKELINVLKLPKYVFYSACTVRREIR